MLFSLSIAHEEAIISSNIFSHKIFPSLSIFTNKELMRAQDR
jgi:hypothetical protein